MIMDSHDNEVKRYDRNDFKKGRTPHKKERNRWKNSNFITSFELALTGIVTAVKEERNMKKHLVLGILVVFGGLVLRVSAVDWLFLLMAIFLVIAGELINSAIENVVDLAADYSFHLRAKKAKDMAAGAVLVLSGFALIVGLIVFVPKIWMLFF